MKTNSMKKLEAWIELRPHDSATINLLDAEDNGIRKKGDLRGFEWNVYTIKNGSRERVYVGFYTYQQAKKYTEEKGYIVIGHDMSKELYENIYKYNKIK